MPKQQFEYITDRAVQGMFFAALESGENSWARRLSFLANSDQASEDYGWLGQAPALAEWIGGRSIDELREFSFRITNKDFSNALRVREKDMRRDKTGQLQTRIGDLARRVNSHPASLMSALIVAGESSLAYDGQFFFDTDHVEGESGTQSNDLTRAIVAAANPTATEMIDGILAGIQAMYGFKDDRGEPINEEAASFAVMVPVPYMTAAVKAMDQVNLTDGESNILRNQGMLNFEMITNPRLPWTDKFAVFRTDGGVKPFILQQEADAEVDILGPGSDHYFNHKEWLIGTDWAGNVGYGMWQHATLMTFTTI